MEITKREVIASVMITAIMLTIGIVISGKVTDYQNDKNAEYQKALQIEDPDLFRYGMETNVGNAFVYGDVQVVDPVSFEEIGGEYLYVEKVEEYYERHEKWVIEKDSEGNEERKKKVWYEWEVQSRESLQAEELVFCGNVFPCEKISLPDPKYISSISGGKTWSMQSGEYVKVRFVFYGISAVHTGTIYTKLADGTISDNSDFYDGSTIGQALDRCILETTNVVFWFVWIALTAGCVAGFCYLDNKWLEN